MNKLPFISYSADKTIADFRLYEILAKEGVCAFYEQVCCVSTQVDLYILDDLIDITFVVSRNNSLPYLGDAVHTHLMWVKKNSET